ncbi:MAG: hypothetical protein RJA81_1630, partial [Planctomycetota bacterium]
MPDSSHTDTFAKKVIVLERRSVLSQLGGIWYLAIPVILTLWICLPKVEVEESQVSDLNLPDTNWWKDHQMIAQNSLQPDSALNSTAKPLLGSDLPLSRELAAKTSGELSLTTDPNTTSSSADTSESELVSAESKLFSDPVKNRKTDEPEHRQNSDDSENKTVNGVVVLKNADTGLNPVTIFDRNSIATENPVAIPHPPQPTPTLIAVEKFGTIPAEESEEDETQKALAEIQDAAEAQKKAMQQDQSLKPLLALHEQAKARQREEDFRKALQKKAETGRRPFRENLSKILGLDTGFNQRAEAITLLIDNDLQGIDTRLFQPMIAKLDIPGRPR